MPIFCYNGLCNEYENSVGTLGGLLQCSPVASHCPLCCSVRYIPMVTTHWSFNLHVTLVVMTTGEQWWLVKL